MALSADEIIVRIASKAHGVVTWQQLSSSGLSDGVIQARIGRVLTRFSRGVYLVGWPTRSALLTAALCSVQGSAAADYTAARLHKLPVERMFGAATTQDIHVVVPHTKNPAFGQPFHVRRTRSLALDDVTTVNGFTCTTIERTICDLGAILRQRQVRHLLEWAITERLMTRASFRACVRSFCRSGRKGSRLIRQLNIAVLDDEPFPASKLEKLGVELFSTPGIPKFVLHFKPPWHTGISGIVDMAWPDLKVIVELDGRRWHSVTLATVKDRARDRLANKNGWFVLRFGWEELAERPTATLAELRSFLEARQARIV